MTMTMWPWPGWASYGPPPGETWVAKVVIVCLALAECWLWWHYLIGPAVRVRLTRPPQPPTETATDAPTDAPAEYGQHLKFEHEQPPEIVIDNSDPPPPLQRGRYDFDWNE